MLSIACVFGRAIGRRAQRDWDGSGGLHWSGNIQHIVLRAPRAGHGRRIPGVCGVYQLEESKGEMMNKSERGFTLIELVVVIVILGILAATAIPKFVNMQVEAADASAKGFAAAISS